MQPVQEHLPLDPGTSFRCFERVETSFPFEWHRHPAYELVFIGRGRGVRFVGDRIEPYEAGELVLLGPDLPHTWASSRGARGRQQAWCLQFGPEFLRGGLLDLPEAADLARLLERSRQGLVAAGAPAQRVAGVLAELSAATGMRRLALLCDCLHGLTACRRWRTLCSARYRPPDLDARSAQRIDRACAWVQEHVHDEVRQTEVAAAVGMAPAAFARFFKRHTGRTLTDYVHSLRIGWASERLRDGDDTVAAIAFAAGFGNLANFNRVFRRVQGMTPREYRTKFRRL